MNEMNDRIDLPSLSSFFVDDEIFGFSSFSGAKELVLCGMSDIVL